MFFKCKIQFWGLIQVAGIVASAGTILGFVGKYAWYLDLFSHFRVQYLLGLVVISLLLLIPRRYTSSGLFAFVAMVNLYTIMPFYTDKPRPISASQSTFRIMSLNVNTKTGNIKLVTELIQQFNPHLIVLEEVSSRWIDGLQQIANDYPYSRTSPREDNFGIALFSKLPFSESEIVFFSDEKIPSIFAWMEVKKEKFLVVGTHPLPPVNKEYSRLRNEQLVELSKRIREGSLPVILLGDLNITPWSYYFKRLLRETGLQNSSIGRGIQATWPTHNPLLRIPIDHCLHSDEIAIIRKNVGPYVGSDHYPILIEFSLR